MDGVEATTLCIFRSPRCSLGLGREKNVMDSTYNGQQSAALDRMFRMTNTYSICCNTQTMRASEFNYAIENHHVSKKYTKQKITILVFIVMLRSAIFTF